MASLKKWNSHVGAYSQIILLLSAFALPAYSADSNRHVTVFGGPSNKNDLNELVRLKLGEFESYSVLGVGYYQSFFQSSEYFDLEWGGQVVKHLENLTLMEVDPLILIRWKWFPWNEYLKTDFGVGEGLSFATGLPTTETEQNIRSALLNYLLVDLNFSLPALPEWALNLRIHHRSGVYGMFFGAKGGSNYLCLGVTRRLW